MTAMTRHMLAEPKVLWRGGHFSGLQFPHNVEQLKSCGPSWYTQAFHKSLDRKDMWENVHGLVRSDFGSDCQTAWSFSWSVILAGHMLTRYSQRN